MYFLCYSFYMNPINFNNYRSKTEIIKNKLHLILIFLVHSSNKKTSILIS